MNKICLSSILILSAIVPLKGNDLVQFPAGRANWTINLSHAPENKLPSFPGDFKTVEIQKDDQKRWTKATYGDGKTRDYWSLANSSMVLSTDPNGRIGIAPPSAFNALPFPDSSFDWISKETLQEQTPISYQGKECFHYKGPSGEAWIDSKTLLPVAMDDGKYVAAYTFHPSPLAALVMPRGYQIMVDSVSRTMGIPPATPATH